MGYEKRIEKAKKKIEENDSILEENKKAILDFDRELRLNDYSEARRYKYISRLPKMAKRIDVPFEDAERSDIEDIVLWLKDRDDINETTRGDYQVLLKRFMRWVGDGEYPDSVNWIKTTNKVDGEKVPEELLTEEDIEELIENAQNKRDKALISTLWETGCRIGELRSLRTGSLEDRQHGLKIVVDGKTGKRRVPLIESVPYLRQWLDEHPHNGNKDTPLWVNIGDVNNGEALSYASINKMLKAVRDRSDVDKPVNPHHFRHSRATYLANKLTEAQLCEYFGWVQGSDVPSQYVHLSGRDIDDAIDSIHGIEKKDKPDKSERSPKKCPRCDEMVEPEAQFCYRCGQALTVESFKKLEEGEEEVGDEFDEIEEMIRERFLDELMDDDEFKKKIKKRIED